MSKDLYSWIYDLLVWEEATDPLGYDDVPPTPKEEPISQPDAKEGHSEEDYNG